MQPSEIRRRVLADHEGFRAGLDRLEALARRVREPDADVADRYALRELGTRLLERLAEHMRWEELYLQPALREADAWGEERAQRMDDDHREQREQLAFVLERLRDAARPQALIAADVLAFAELLRADMVEEERDMLDERVLRDDVVAIDLEAG